VDLNDQVVPTSEPDRRVEQISAEKPFSQFRMFFLRETYARRRDIKSNRVVPAVNEFSDIVTEPARGYNDACARADNRGRLDIEPSDEKRVRASVTPGRHLCAFSRLDIHALEPFGERLGAIDAQLGSH